MTARPEAAAFGYFDEMRQAWFPEGRNKVPAHVSLFHTLPVGLLEGLKTEIAGLLPALPANAETSGIRFLGRGNAYALDAPGLDSLHHALAATHAPVLTAQDRQAYRPHITVQNKVDALQAKALNERLTAAFVPIRFSLVAIDLWHYRPDGTWMMAATVPWARTG